MTRTDHQSPLAVFWTFLKLGLTSFGGPAAHISFFRKELVERQKWIKEDQFTQLLALCQFLPGPASSQLGFALGLQRAGWLGACAAFIAFTAPSAVYLVLFASLLPYFQGDLGLAVIAGLKMVAVVVVADALLGMSKSLCPDPPRKTIAITATCLLLALQSPYAQLGVIALGALMGFVWIQASTSSATTLSFVRFGQRSSLSLFILFAALFASLGLLASTSSFTQLASDFYRTGSLVFGGGHVVLPLLEESAVNGGLVDQQTFLAGYGAAQAAPGPLFAFAAYLGAFIEPGSISVLGALVALVCVFLPGFLLLLAALPSWQSVTQNPSLQSAVLGVNASVVGLLAAAFYDPIITTSIRTHIDVLIALIGILILTVWKRSPLWVVAWCVLASVTNSQLSA